MQNPVTTFRQVESEALGIIVPNPEIMHAIEVTTNALPKGSAARADALALQRLMNARSLFYDLVEPFALGGNRTMDENNLNKFHKGLTVLKHGQLPNKYAIYFWEFIYTVTCANQILAEQIALDRSESLDHWRLRIRDLTGAAERETNPLLKGLRYSLVYQIEP